MSNHHCEAYTGSPKAVRWSLEIKFNVGVFAFPLAGTTLTFRIGLKRRSDRGRRTGHMDNGGLAESGRAYDFLVEYRRESVHTPVVFRVREGSGKKDRTRTRYCQTKENEVRQDES